MKKITFFDRFQARILTPFLDNNIWKLQEYGKNIFEIKRIFNKERMSFFYPDEELSNVKTIHKKFLAHNFTNYIYLIKDAVLEPNFGWVIIKSFNIFKYSFPFALDPWDVKKRRPKSIEFLLKGKNMLLVDQAASIKYGWQNYYHFYVDCLTQLAVLDEFDSDNTIPVIVPVDFADSRFIQEFLELSNFIKRKIIVQKAEEYIKVKKLYLIKDSLLSENIDKIIHSLSGSMSPDIGRKIFILRSKETGRTINNMEEVEELLKDFGFESIDSSKLPLKKQIEIFSSASHVIGIHGAGMVNILFRKDLSLSVLEIFPNREFAPEHYKNISKKFGYQYMYIFGNGKDESNNFKVDILQLKEKLIKFNSKFS